MADDLREPAVDDICPRLTRRGTPCSYRKASFGDGHLVEYAPACNTHMWDQERARFHERESWWLAGQKSGARYWKVKLDKAIIERDKALDECQEVRDEILQLRSCRP